MQKIKIPGKLLQGYGESKCLKTVLGFAVLFFYSQQSFSRTTCTWIGPKNGSSRGMKNLSLSSLLKGFLTAWLIVVSSLYSTVGAQNCTTPPAPTVTATITYCQNATASPLTATGSNLIWGGSMVSGSVGGTSAPPSGAQVFVDATYSNKKTNFSTLTNNVTITSVDYYIPAWQATNGLVVGIFNSSGAVIATSSTTTTRTASSTSLRIVNTFNYTLAAAGNYSIGLVAGIGNLGYDNPSFPITEPSGSIRVTGVTTAGNRIFSNIQFTTPGGSSIAPTPSTSALGSTQYTVTQTVNGCVSPPSTITVNVTALDISQTPTSGLIADFNFSGNAMDKSGNNNGVLQNNPTLSSDRYNQANQAYSFNGSNQYVSTSNSYANPTNFTISLWFKTSTTTGGKLIGFGNSQTGQSGNYDRHIYMNNSGQIYFGVYNGAVRTINTALSYNDNVWHNATATLSTTSGMTLYIDGEVVANNAGVTTAENITGYWKIGGDNMNGWTEQPSSYYFSGVLDDAVIYHRALSAAEVDALVASPDGAGNNGPVCAGSPLQLTAKSISGATYSWTGPNGFTSSQQNPTLTYSAVNAGIYTLRISLAGCSATAYTTVKSSDNPGQWTGNVSSDWSNPNNWCNGIAPTATTDVIIPSGAVRMPVITTSVSSNNLTINSGATLTTAAAGTLNISGNLTNSGTMTNNGTTNFNGTSGQQSFSGVSTFNNLTITNSNGLILPNATTVNQMLIVNGSLNANNFNIAVRGNWTNNSAANSFIAGTSTVTFNGTAAQVIGGTFNSNFNNLTIANTGSVTLTNNTQINGNLTVSTGTFDLSTFTANRTTSGGTLTVSNNATLKIGGTNTYPSNYSTNTLVVASTVEYSGTNQPIANQPYGNLTFSSSAGAAVKTLPTTPLIVLGNLTSSRGAGTSVTFTAGANVSINGNVSIGASTVFNGANYSHNIGGNWVNNGTFNGNTSTVVFSGSGASVSGPGAQNFNNLTVAGSLINFAAGDIMLSGNLATTGSGSFSQAAGGTLFMTGTGKTITGSGIVLHNLTVSGSVMTYGALVASGNLSVSGSLVAGSGVFTMNGSSKTISGTGNISFITFAVPGSVTTSSNFTISSGIIVNGSLSASSGTATFTGTSTLSGTANLFNSTVNGTSLQLSANSTLGVAGELTIASGTLDVTSSAPNTVNFNGSGAQNINPITYSNLVLSNGGTKTGTGNFTTTHNLTIGSGTNFNASSHTHSIYGNWNNNGNFTAGTSTVEFLGPATAYINGPTIFNNLNSHRSTSTTELILQNDISATVVNMIDGIISTGSNTLTITGTRTGNGYIFGNIRRTHPFTTGVPYAFEGPENTITFSAVSAVNSITVSVVKGSISDFPFGGSVSREYNIVVPTGTYTATLRLHYEDEELNGNPEGSMGLWRYNGSVWGAVGKTANSVSANYVEYSSLSDITNRWTFSDQSNVVQWNGSVSSDWNTAANWTVLQGSASRPPSATDIVNLGTASFTNNPTISSSVNVKNIIFGSAQAVTLSMANGGSLTSGDISGVLNSSITHTINANNQTVNVNGNLTLSEGIAGQAIDLNIGSGTVNIAGSLFQSGDAAVNFSDAGNLNIYGDFEYTGGTFNAGNGTVTYNGEQNQNIAAVDYNNLTVNKTSGLTTIGEPTDVFGNLLIAAGGLDNLSSLNVEGNIDIYPEGTLQNQNIIEVGGNWNNQGIYRGGGGQAYIRFVGDGTQTISATVFDNVEIDKPVGVQALLTGDIVINGDLMVTSGTLNLGVFNSGRGERGGGTATLMDSATIIFGANNFSNSFANYVVSSLSTVIVDGTIDQTLFLPGISIGNLILRNSGLKILASSLAVNGDLTIEEGASFDAGTNTITSNGNWIDEGDFIPSSSTAVFIGTSKNISGNTTFNRATIVGSYTILNDVTFNRLLNVTSTGSISGGSSTHTTLHGDLINSGILTALGTTTYSGNVVQTLSLINAVSTVAITVNFNGSVPPVLNSTSSPEFGNLNINNTGGIYPSVDWTIRGALTIGEGASFNGGESSHNFLGSVTNNGSMTSEGFLNFIPSSAATLNLSSDFASTGTVVLGGAGIITFAGETGSFQDVIVSNTNVAGVTASSGWNIGHDLSINSNSVLNAGSYTYSVRGDFINRGTLNSGTSTFVMNGDTAQSIFSNSAFNNLTINKESNSVTLQADATVNGILNFISGNITTGELVLIQPASGSVSGAAANTGWVNGNLQKNIATGSTVKSFELGDAINYTPISVAFESVTASGDLVSTTITGDHPNLASSTFRSDRTVNRYWVFTNEGVEFTNASLTMNWVPEDVDQGAVSSNFNVGNFDNTTWVYTPVQDQSATSIQTTEVTSLDDVAVGESCTLTTDFSFPETLYCSIGGTVAPILSGTAGTFSAGSGLSIDPITGVVDLDASTPGTYVVANNASSEGGCTSVSTATISIGIVPDISVAATETCVDGSTGTITVFINDGASPYFFSLNGGPYQESNIFSGLAAGAYIVNVRGRAGCAVSTTVNIMPYSTSTQDQSVSGVDTWVGHMYDGTNFNYYLGQFTEEETFDKNFGGSQTCFTVFSDSLSRSIFTENFSVKYRMQSSKKGLYVVDLGSDDGGRLTVDDALIFSNWVDHGYNITPNVLVNLTGESALLYEYYEQGGDNRVSFGNFVPVLENQLSTNITQDICVGNTGISISGDTFGTLPAGISLNGTGYQWSYSTTPEGARIIIAGETGATFTPSTTIAPFNTGGTYYIYRNATLSSSRNLGLNPFIATNESNAAIITVTPAPEATINYPESPYRTDGGTASIVRIGSPGGVYSSTAGLAINELTGDITLSSSTVGTYTVAYTIESSGVCDPFQTTTIVTIDDACGADYTWLGTNTNWFDPSNWCAGQVPPSEGTEETIYIPLTANHPEIEGNDVSINGTLVLEIAAQLIISSDVSFTLTPPSDVNASPGSLIIIEEGANYRNFGAGVPLLQVNQLFTGDKGWRMIGGPISTTYATLTTGFETQGFPGSTNPSLQPNLLWWDETDQGTTLQGWRQPGNLADAAPVGRGHYFYIFNGAAKPSPASGSYSDVLPLTMSITGTEVNLTNGMFDFGVTFTARDTNLVVQADTLIEVNQADEGFNLIANPTASMLDWDATSGWSKTNMDESIYVWDNISQSFLTWNGSIGTLGSGRIAPYQAFWVRSNAVSPVLQLSGNGAKTQTNAPFYRKSETEEPSFIHLFVTGDNLAAESFISFGADGESGKDPKDAYQLESLADDWLLLYSYGSLQARTPLVINHQAPIDTTQKVIPLHLAASKSGQAFSGTYLMNWTLPSGLDAGVSVILMDHVTKQAINMREVSAHAFEFDAPQLPNLRTGKFQDPLALPKAIVFQSPNETGAVDPNARQFIYKPQHPFTIFISHTADENVGYLPLLPKLLAPVPNPFETQTKIRFYLPTAEKASIQIINQFGQMVGEFPEKAYEEGIHDLEWIPSAIDLPRGMYIIRLMTSQYQMSEKLIKN